MAESQQIARGDAVAGWDRLVDYFQTSFGSERILAEGAPYKPGNVNIAHIKNRKIISGMILSIGYMMAGWTQRKQALHDMMASTLVVRKELPRG